MTGPRSSSARSGRWRPSPPVRAGAREVGSRAWTPLLRALVLLGLLALTCCAAPDPRPVDLDAIAVRRDTREELEGEFADVLAWLASLASIAGIDLEEAARKKYERGCPRCEATPCACG